MNNKQLAISLIESKSTGEVLSVEGNVVRVKMNSGDVSTFNVKDTSKLSVGVDVEVDLSSGKPVLRPKTVKEIDFTPSTKQAHGRFATKDYETPMQVARFNNDRI